MELGKIFWENNPRLKNFVMERSGIRKALQEISNEIDIENEVGFYVETIEHAGKEERILRKRGGVLVIGLTADQYLKQVQGDIRQKLGERGIDLKLVKELL